MVVVGDGDVGAGPDVVIRIEIEISDRAGVVMALEISADLVVAISNARREQAALRVQQEARRFCMAQAETTTMSESCSCRRPSASK